MFYVPVGNVSFRILCRRGCTAKDCCSGPGLLPSRYCSIPSCCMETFSGQDSWSLCLHGCQTCALQEILTVSHDLQELEISFFRTLFFLCCTGTLLLVESEMGAGGDEAMSYHFRVDSQTTQS